MPDSRLVQLPDGYIGGCLPRDDEYGQTFAPGDRYSAYPRNDWPSLAAHNVSGGLLATRVYDQGREGSCACQASAQGWNLTMRLTNPKWCPPDGVSAMPAYRALARGPNQGTTIASNLVFLRDVGTLPIDTPANREWMRKYGLNPEHVMPEIGYYTPMPRGCEETQRCFRIADARDCGRCAEIFSAAADNKVGVFGLDMHAMCFVNFHQSGLWKLDGVNSWGRQGKPLGPAPAIQYGGVTFTEREIDSQIVNYGAFTIEAVYVPDQFLRHTT